MAFSITNTFTDGTAAVASEVNQNFTDVVGAINNRSAQLGEVRMFALSLTGAVTKAGLISKGWAICDGTTPATQGITSPTITTTPNLENKFIRMSDDETSGTTGGSATHKHESPIGYSSGTVYASEGNGSDIFDNGNSGTEYSIGSKGSATNVNITVPYTNTVNSEPPYYEMAFFIYVKEI